MISTWIMSFVTVTIETVNTDQETLTDEPGFCVMRWFSQSCSPRKGQLAVTEERPCQTAASWRRLQCPREQPDVAYCHSGRKEAECVHTHDTAHLSRLSANG
ncbi:hypothetical protein MHYP_G00021070 [Metynnis hypsauchen]